jgi:hypothetical protein
VVSDQVEQLGKVSMSSKDSVGKSGRRLWVFGLLNVSIAKP